LRSSPSDAKFKVAVIEFNVPKAKNGGTDKGPNGHRIDSIPIANGVIQAGASCEVIYYSDATHDLCKKLLDTMDGIIVRVNPGKYVDITQSKLDALLMAQRARGCTVMSTPEMMQAMGAKDALCQIANLRCGLPDTLAYYTREELEAGFKKNCAFQPRVIKQNRGSSGEGIWIIKLKSGEYCSSFGEKSCEDDEVLTLMEANDNHEEEHTVAEFIEFCVVGRTEKSGEWTSKGQGKYLEGGKEAGGQLVDQRFCPRIVEGELRYNLVVDQLVGIIHKKPKEGGISAVGGTGSIYTYYGPEEPKFNNLTDGFLKKDLPLVMPALGLSEEPVPLWWTTDFILASPEGTPTEEEKWIVGEFNCSCVGISRCLAAYCKDDTPEAKYSDISAEDLEEAEKYGTLMGVKALEILSK